MFVASFYIFDLCPIVLLLNLISLPFLLQKSSHSVDSSTIRSLASIMDIMDSSGKLPNTHHPNQNLNHSLLLRHPRHFYGRQYSRRNSANNAGASSSRSKGAPRDEKLPFKFGSQRNSDFGHHTGRLLLLLFYE